MTCRDRSPSDSYRLALAVHGLGIRVEESTDHSGARGNQINMVQSHTRHNTHKRVVTQNSASSLRPLQTLREEGHPEHRLTEGCNGTAM